MNFYENLLSPVVVVAVVTGLFGILDLRMRHQFKRHQQYVDPIKEQVVNGHGHINLRSQLDQLEFKLRAHADNSTNMLNQLTRLTDEFERYRIWSERENDRQWQAIGEGRKDAK